MDKIDFKTDRIDMHYSYCFSVIENIVCSRARDFLCYIYAKLCKITQIYANKHSNQK